MSVDPKDFSDRLDAISDYQGKPFGRVHLIFDAEHEYSLAATKYKGYLALSDAFKGFFLETVERLNTECRPKITTPLSEFYGLLIPRLATNFQSLCGAERLALHGYPLQAFTILRNAFDNLVLTSAVMQGMTDFYSIEGVVPGTVHDPKSAKRLRKDTEYAIRKKMTGDQSGLSQSTLDEFAVLDALFDHEVHGAQLSLAAATPWLKKAAPLPIVPRFEEMPFALFMNRYLETSWMLHRVLPLAQPPSVPLAVEWQGKWRVIDDSFEVAIGAITQQFGKKIGAAMVEFVHAKFPFTEKFLFPL